MPTVSVTLTSAANEQTGALVEEFAASPMVDRIFLCGDSESLPEERSQKVVRIEDTAATATGLNQVIANLDSDYLLWVRASDWVRPGSRMLERLTAIADDPETGMVYSDFREESAEGISDHPLIDFQFGSCRDSFDFGSLCLFSTSAIKAALSRHGELPQQLRWGALYDLRLKLSIDFRISRIPEFLSTRVRMDLRSSGEKQFDYVDPRQREYQIEMEQIVTERLKRIGAFLEPQFKSPNAALRDSETVRASVIIPVRNRERTITDAVESALSQDADFDFNVIVVDNHSTDRTTEILSGIAQSNSRLIHLRPERRDLCIGGCWNEALFSPHCGRYAVQLDSDDLYTGSGTLARMVARFQEGDYGMVIGSYTIVDFDLKPIPPGLIDHREWTRDNGRNNALRINGLGAPRAFDAVLLRGLGGLPNTSYGEDYAAALRISREYEIGR